MDASGLLMQFGLSKQEAAIYLTLLEECDATGYEVAKLTGISRSNVYTALASLVDRGAANLMEGAATRYAAVPPEEFCRNAIRRMQEYAEELRSCLPGPHKDPDGYLTIKGEAQIVCKMKNMIEDANERVYVSAPGEALDRVMTELAGAAARGVKIVLITDGPAAPQGMQTHRSATALRQIRLIADSAEVLTGDIEDGENSTCLYSRKKNLVDLIKDALKNEIKLAEYEVGRAER